MKITRLSFWNAVSRILFLLLTPAFFATSITFHMLNIQDGKIEGFHLEPLFFTTELNTHYQHIWIYDTLGALFFGLLLEKRWICKNLFVMGSLSAIASTWSRLIPVIDSESCNLCKQCEKVCLVTNSECIQCGRCVDACKRDALKFRFIWNRTKYLSRKATLNN